MTLALVISRRAELLQALLSGPLGPGVRWRSGTELAEAVLDAADPRPDLVVVDLPSLPGEQASWLPWLRPRLPSTPLLGVVQEAGPSLRSALAADLDGLLVDPFDLAEVESQLQRALRRRAAEPHRVPPTSPGRDPTEALAEFLKGLTHEVNNPMASVSAMLQILESDSDDSVLKQRYSVMRGELDRVQETFAELENFVAARKPNKMKLDLAALLSELIPNGADWTMPDQLPVLGDQAQLRTVLTRLLDLFATAEAEELRGTVSASPGPVLIQLRGPLPADLPEDPSALFLPYHRSSHQDYRRSLRLAACHGIVRAHRGRLEARAEGQHLLIELALPSMTEPEAPPGG